MARAKICDMCGCVISTERQLDPVRGYTITIQRPKFFKTETVSIDLCQKCFDQIIEISKRKGEEDERTDTI